MAMDKNRLGDAIVDRILSFAGIAPSGTDETLYRQMWRAIADEIIKEIDVNADIVLNASDIPIDPGSFIDSITFAPITGTGQNQAVTLSGKIE